MQLQITFAYFYITQNKHKENPMDGKGNVNKSGLTQGQIEYAKGVFKQVELRPICTEHGLSYNLVYNVMRGTSSRIDIFKKALELAEAKVKEKQDLLDSIPSV